MWHSWPVLVALYWALGVTTAFVAHRALRQTGAGAVYAALIGIVWPWALAACAVAALVRLIEERGPH